jgi:hypothetical protein
MASQKRNFIVYATVAGRDLGTFDTWTGGDGGSEDQRYTAGGGKEKSYGGKQTREPITIGRVFEDDRDAPLYDWLDAQRGKAEATFRKQPVDDEENPVGKAIVRTGKLIKVTDPNADSNDSSLRMYELELSPVA